MRTPLLNRIRKAQSAVLLLLFVLVQSCALSAPYGITYTLQPVPPVPGTPAVTHVEVHVTGVKGEKSLRFQMAVWSPGDYHVMNHSKYVKNVSARSIGPGEIPGSSFVARTNKGTKSSPLNITALDANTWEVATDGKVSDLTFEYDLSNSPAGYFSENVQVREKYAFFNGPATYMYVVGHKENSARVRVALPTGWKKAITPLDAEPADSLPAGEVGFSAPDFDTLADSPLVAGDFETRSFNYANRPHTLVFFNAHQDIDYDGFLPVVQKVVAEENRLMGGPPYKQYMFFIDVNGRGGGLEHLNSQRIAWGRNFPVRFASSFVGHEFFHLWNVKRIRPSVLGPFDYVNPPKTRNLWWSEGVTEYFAQLSCVRAGLMKRSDFLEQQAGSIQSLQSTPARLRVSADDSSYRVWEANNSSGYGGLNYYLKGQLIGLCLDLKIRRLTRGKSSLDDVMRDLMARHGLPKPGFPEDGLRDAVIRAGGEQMGAFYDLLARSTLEMPFAECLSYAGLRMDETGGSHRITVDPNAGPEAVELRESWLTAK